MKIGFDAKRLFHNATGLGNYSRDLIRILAKSNPENKYYLYNSKPKKIDRIEIDSKTIFEKIFTGNSLFSAFWRFSSIKKTLKKDGIEIFHGLSGEIPFGISETKIKSIVSIHDLIFVRYPNLYSIIDRKIYFWKFKYAAKNADLIVAISEQTKNDIVDFLKIDPKKIKVIYQGCATNFKAVVTTSILKEVKDKYQLPEKFLLNVGTIEERKNILSVFEALKETTIPLVLIGKKTSYYEKLVAFTKKNNLTNQIIYLENIPLTDLSVIYKLATIFVYPSIFEGFGIPIIEALYSKTPVITSTGSCFSEAGGEDTIYIKPNAIQDLKKAIELLWNDENLRQEKIEKGFQFVQKFNDDTISKEWIKTYKSLLNE